MALEPWLRRYSWKKVPQILPICSGNCYLKKEARIPECMIPCRRPGTTGVVGKNLCVHMCNTAVESSALKNSRNGSERRIESRSRGLKVYTAVLIGPVRLPDPAAGYIWHANYDYRTSMSTPMSTRVSLWPVLRILNLVLNLVLYLRP